MTNEFWLWSGGLLCGWISYRLTRLTCQFRFNLCILDVPTWVPQIFLDWPKRWLLYYLPIIAMTCLSAWLIPHWIDSVAAVLWVAYGFKAGSRNALLNAIRTFAGGYEKDGLPPDEALTKANELVSSITMRKKLTDWY